MNYTTITHQHCTTCKECKPLEDFHRNSRVRTGRHTRCKECTKIYDRQYKKQNHDRVIANVMNWQANNIEQRRKHARDSYWRNREDRIIQHGDQYRKRRAAKYGAVIDKDITIAKLYERDEGICGICQEKCNWGDKSMDHIKPLSKGGTHTWDNVQLAHLVCNSKKGNKDVRGL